MNSLNNPLLNNERYCNYWQSPIGWIEITSVQLAKDQYALASLYFREPGAKTINANSSFHDFNQVVIEQLAHYFSGHRTSFNLPLFMPGTEFQQSVWSALQAIPFGKTTTYRSLARQINRDKAIRAVGTANGRNPISIIVPCHRVIGSSGSLTGYAGGIKRKAWLLKHEGFSMP